MTDPPPSLKILNFRLSLDMERWPNPHPCHCQIFKFQIWPGHGKMTNPPTKNFKFQIWPGHGKMTEPLPLQKFKFWFSLDMERWLPPPFTEILNFRFGLDMVRWLTPQPSPKILNFRFGLDMVRWSTIQPLLKFWNFRFGLDMERWLTPHPHWNFKFQIWPGHRKMTNPKLSPENF